MANIIDELLISIGADIAGALKGISTVEKTVGGMAGTISAASDASGAALAAIGADGAASMGTLSNAAEKAGQDMSAAAAQGEKAMGGLANTIKGLASQMAAVAAPLVAAFGAKQAISTFIETADALGTLSNKIGISVEDLDAWGAANEAAGGSAKALQDSLKSFYEKTGRPADEFFKLGEKIEGMTDRQKMAYLQAQGVALDAVPIFMQGQKEADRLVAKYRETAFTAQDAKTAAAFKTAWFNFSRAAQSVGNILARMVLPVLTVGLDLIGKAVAALGSCPPALLAVGTGLLMAFGAKQLGGMDKVVGRLGDVAKAMIAIGKSPLKSLRAGLTAAGAAMRAFGASTASAALPVLAVAAAVAAAAFVIEDIVAFCQGRGSIFGNVLEAGLDKSEVEGIRDSFRQIGDAVKKVFGVIGPAVMSVFSVAIKAVAKAISLVISLIAGVVVAAVKAWNWIAKLPEKIGSAFGSAVEWCKKAGDAVTAVPEKISDTFGKATNWARRMIETVSAIPETLLKGLAGIYAKLSEFVGFPDTVTAGLKRVAAEGFAAVGGMFKSLIAAVPDIGAAMLENIVGGITRASTEGLNIIGGLFAKIAASVPNVGSEILSGIRAAFSDALSIARGALGKVADLIKDCVASPFKKAFTGIKSVFGFGDESGSEAGGVGVDERTKLAVLEKTQLSRSNSVNTQASVNVVNNITTADNPQAIGAAVGGTMEPAALRMGGLIGQSVSGVCLKGG